MTPVRLCVCAEEAQRDEWSPWSVCSVSCGEGWQSRARTCMTSAQSTQCTGPLRENRPCNNTAVCPGTHTQFLFLEASHCSQRRLTCDCMSAVNGSWDEWAPWSLCSSTCGRGYRDRVRTCKEPRNGGSPCRGPTKQTKFCNIAVCPGQCQH